MEHSKKKKITIILSIVALFILCLGGTYAWFTHNRLTDTDSVSAKTNEDTVELYVSSEGGTAFQESYEADIVQLNASEKKELMPVSTNDLKEFVFASVSTPEKLQFARDTKGSYYYHGRVYLKAKATGNHTGQKMTIYLDGSDASGGEILTCDSKQLLSASRVGLTVGGKSEIINFDNQKAANVVSYANSKTSYVSDPSNYVNKYLLQVKDGVATRPEKALMNIELNKEYPVDIYYYMEGCDEDCTDDISGQNMKLHLAFYGVLE